MNNPNKLHIGCGHVILEKWWNIDLEAFDGVNQVIDVRDGLPFKNESIKYIFAEHFLEHLDKDEGLFFLKECYRVLKKKEGVLRLSTPNLDWVWVTHYRLPASDDQKRYYSMILNRAFYGWGHKHLYNDTVLIDTLKDAGFSKIKFFQYGHSDISDLTGLEHHERYDDTKDLPHVLIAQAYK